MRAEPLIDSKPSIGRSHRADAVAPFGKVVGWFCRVAAVYEQRRQLRYLSDDMLKDIGASRADVDRESGRWFWDLP